MRRFGSILAPLVTCAASSACSPGTAAHGSSPQEGTPADASAVDAAPDRDASLASDHAAPEDAFDDYDPSYDDYFLPERDAAQPDDAPATPDVSKTPDASTTADASTTPEASTGYPPQPVAGSACGAVTQRQTVAWSPHVTECSVVAYATNPPSSGPHYPVWGAFRSYGGPLPRGYWVHDLEHGAIVFSYRCDGGCDSEVALAQATIDSLPVDPVCPSGGPKRRVVMTPDPFLDTRWAASAWGWTLRSDCFEPTVFAAFAVQHYAKGSENKCEDGYDFSTPDGDVAYAPGCGGLDGGTGGLADGGPHMDAADDAAPVDDAAAVDDAAPADDAALVDDAAPAD